MKVAIKRTEFPAFVYRPGDAIPQWVYENAARSEFHINDGIITYEDWEGRAEVPSGTYILLDKNTEDGDLLFLLNPSAFEEEFEVVSE